MIVTIAVGNSDDKLSQSEWAAFIADITRLVEQAREDDGAHIHFAGFSAPAAPWQNALWALDLTTAASPAARGWLRTELADLCGLYRQDAIAWWEAGQTEMIPPAVVGG